MPVDQTVTAPPSALTNFQHLPDDALARVATVRALFDCSVPTVWRWAKNGRLPAPVRVGGVTGWRVGDLRKILAGGQ
jgi:predicted DNA-binding transcriptional regulator AlpA